MLIKRLLSNIVVAFYLNNMAVKNRLLLIYYSDCESTS